MNTKIFQPLIDAPKSDVLLLMIHTWYPWMPPLGISYISSYLESKGFNALLFDFNSKLYNSVSEDKKRFWDISTISSLPFQEIVRFLIESFSEEIDALIDIIIKRPEPIIGFSTNYLSIHVVNHIAKNIKERNSDKLLVVGGPGCFWDHDRSAIEPGAIDIFVLGEGERPFYTIVENFYKKSNLENIPGTIFVKNKEEIANSLIDPIIDLDSIAYPNFKNLDLDDYGFGEKQTRTLPLLISRGCISKCTFCVDHFMCAPFRMREPENIIAEIKYHINENGVRNFSFNDLLCNGDLKKLKRFAELIKEESIKIQWGSYAVARGDMDLELLKSLKDAGCVSLCYGIESGSDKVLKTMCKIYVSSDAERVLRLTKQAGIKSTFNIIIGYPGEGKREFKQTLNFVKRNKDYIESIINVSTLFINPTAALGLHPEKFGIYFPKRPRSFKFISLKKCLVPKYYKLFGNSLAVKDTKGVDISEFVDRSGNTKPVRLKRLVKTLYFLQKLGLFRNDPIINVYATKSKKVKKALSYISNRQSLKLGDLTIKFDREGFVKVFLKQHLLTAGPGLNVAFWIRDKWYDSSQYRWEIKKINNTKIEILVKMNDIAVEQRWVLTIKPEGLFWDLQVYFKAKNYIVTETKIGLQLSDLYERWYSRTCQGDFPDLDDNWRSVDLEDTQEVSVVTEGSKRLIPSLVKISNIKSTIPLSLRMESSRIEHGFRFLAFKNKIIYPYNNDKFNVRLFLNFQELDKAPTRKDAEESFLDKKEFKIVEAEEELEERKDSFCVKKSNFLSLRVNKGLKLYYNQLEVTSESGAVVSCNYDGNIFDTRSAIWSPINDNNDDIFDIYWKNLCFQIRWGMRIKRKDVFWNFKVNSLDDVILKELKFGLFLSESYDSWHLDSFKGRLSGNIRDRWDCLPLVKGKSNRIILDSSCNGLPSLLFTKPKLGFFQIEVPDLNITEGKILYVVLNDVCIKSKEPLNLNCRLSFKE